LGVIGQTLKLVKQIIETHGMRYEMRIFSQGDSRDFMDLEALGAHLVIDSDPIYTMHELVGADVLIMAKSTFSYVAGLLSDGISIYEPCAYPPMASWLVRGNDGTFNVDDFARQLHCLIKARRSRPCPKPD
jgi:hypothetical protein